MVSEKIIHRAVLAIAVIVGIVGLWWLFRLKVGAASFELVRDYIRYELGLSLAVATAIGVAIGIACSVLVAVVTFKTHILVSAAAAVLLVGVPLAFWVDRIAEGHCFNRKTSEPLCEVWEAPSGEKVIVRYDAAAPKGGWRALRKATVEDVRVYSGSPEEQLARLPRPLAVETCSPGLQFFDAEGNARVYWSKGNPPNLWDRPGRHPTTGAQLLPITREVAEHFCKSLAAETERRRAQQEARQAQEAAAKEALDRQERERLSAEERAAKDSSRLEIERKLRDLERRLENETGRREQRSVELAQQQEREQLRRNEQARGGESVSGRVTESRTTRYIDSAGCLREADGGFVVGYRSDCR